MKKKIKPITMLAVCLAAFVAAASVMFAWMSNTKTIRQAKFTLKRIDSTIDMYYGIDSNYNGVPDLLSTFSYTSNEATTTVSDNYYATDTNIANLSASSVWKEYSSSYYTEKYAFAYQDTKYLLSEESSTNTLKTFTIEDVEPSRIYTFKFAITNYNASNSGTLDFGFENSVTEFDDKGNKITTSYTAENSAWAQLLTYFDCRLLVVGTETTTDTETNTTTTTAKYTQKSTGSEASEWTNFNVTKTTSDGSATYSLAETNLSSSAVTYNIKTDDSGSPTSATISGLGDDGTATATGTVAASTSGTTTTYTITYTYNNKTYTITTTALSGTANPIASDEDRISIGTASSGSKKVDVWLQIRMKPTATLSDLGLSQTSSAVTYSIENDGSGSPTSATIFGLGDDGTATATGTVAASTSGATTTYTITYTYSGKTYTITTATLSGTVSSTAVTFPSFKITFNVADNTSGA